MVENVGSTHWESCLRQIQWSINSSPNATTKVTPQELLFGFRPRPIFGEKLALELHQTTHENGSPEIKLPELREEVSRRIKKNQEQQKTRFDQKHKPPEEFHEGDLVVVFREPVSTGESKKLQRRFRGPYTVTKVLHGDRYLLTNQNPEPGKRRFNGVFASDSMKKVISPDDSDIAESSEED